MSEGGQEARPTSTTDRDIPESTPMPRSYGKGPRDQMREPGDHKRRGVALPHGHGTPGGR